MKKNLLIAPLALLVALVLGSCSGEKEKVSPADRPAGKTANPKAARVVNNISFYWSNIASNGIIWIPYNAACGCYKRQLTVSALNGTYQTIYGPQFIVGRIYEPGLTLYRNISDSQGSQREFVIESIDQLVNSTVTLMNSYAFRWYPSDNTGEAWPHGTNSSVTFTVRSRNTTTQEAVWGIFMQSPYSSVPVYGDDAVTLGKQ